MRLRNWKWAALPMLGLCAASASAYDPIVLKQGWERVASAKSGPCEAEVGTNGRFYVIAVYGMEPGENASFTLSDAGMRPIERKVTADGEGVWSDYYIPFRFGRAGESVTAQVSGESCDVSLDFDWQRFRG